MSAAAKPNEAAPGPATITLSDFDSLLDQVAHPQLLEEGCVNIVSIAPVRDKLGERWGRSRDNIYRHIEKQLGRQIGAADYQCRISETDYLLSFPGENRQSAQLRCLRILQEMFELLLGQFTIEQLSIRAVTKRVGSELTAEAVDVATLHRMATGAAARTAPPPAKAVPAPPRFALDSLRIGTCTLYLDFEFLPIWDLRHDAISSFSLNVIVETDLSRAMGELRADRSHLKPDELTAIDLAAVKHGQQILTHMFQQKSRFILHLPCSYETLASSRARPQFLEALKSFGPGLRRYIAFELRDLPSGVPQSRLSELATLLSPFARGVIAIVPAQRALTLSCKGCGLLGTALELEADGMPETEAFALINTFRERAEGAGEQMIAYGVATKSLVMACWSMGLSHISGAAIAPPCKLPYQMSRFYTLDLYADADVALRDENQAAIPD